MMKKRVRLLLSISLILLSMTVAFVSCELVTKEPEKGTMRVLSIGISYLNSDVGPLYGPIADAPAISVAFKKNAETTGLDASIVTMLQADGTRNTSDPDYPSKKNILTKLSQFARDSQDNDITVVYFSGHGDGEKNTFDETQEPYCLITATVDTASQNRGKIFSEYNRGTGGDPDTYKILPECRLPATVLQNKLKEIKGKKLLILDCCYSGGHLVNNPSFVNTEEVGLQAWNEGIRKLFSPTEEAEYDLFVITASRNDLLSYEPAKDKKGKHGYFTNAILNGMGVFDDFILNGDMNEVSNRNYILPPPACSNKVLTLDGLYNFAKRTMEYKNKQRPQIIRGPYDLVLFQF